MSWMKLADFQKLSGLSDSTLLWMLKENRLGCRLDPHGLMIDTGSTGSKALISAVLDREREIFEADERMLAERFSKILLENIDDIVEQAMARFQSVRERP